MQTPAVVPITADRWVTCVRDIDFFETDLTGAAFVAQVRQVPDATGSPLINLATVTSSVAEGIKLMYAGTDTITNHIAAGRLDAVPGIINPNTGVPYVAADTLILSWLRIRINDTTMAGMPEPVERGTDQTFAWDMLITPSGGLKDKYAGGIFVVRAGVTQ